jgi:WD40 repeat protein
VINCIRIKNDRILLSASGDSTLKIWNFNAELRTSTNVMTLVGHSSDVYCVETMGDYVASGGADSLVILWSLHTGHLLYKLPGHLGVVRFIFMDEQKLVTGGDAKKIMVWDYKVNFSSWPSVYGF